MIRLEKVHGKNVRDRLNIVGCRMSRKTRSQGSFTAHLDSLKRAIWMVKK